MSANDDAAAPQGSESSPGKALLVLSEPAAQAASGAGESASGAKAAGARDMRRWIAPAALVVLAASAGWYAGAHTTMAFSANHRAAIESSLGSELTAQRAAVAALEARLKSMEDAPKGEAVVKPAIEILARRIDEIARTQTAALSQTSGRLDRTDKEIGGRLDRISERMERIEKQVSSPAPVSATQKNVTPVPRSGPEESAREPEAPPIRNYVLRDVFRGGALVESRHGLVEVFPGAQLPGAGRVRSVEKRDGRWVVVTTTGVIESR